MQRDFKESGFLYFLGFFMVVFIVVQSLFFLGKAWKRGKEIGLKTETLKRTVLSSVLFTVAPAFAILATVITLANALGLVLPWIRLTVIGNISYETTAAITVLEAFGIRSGVNAPVTDPVVFSTAAWVMTIGSVFPIVIMPFLVKRVQKSVGKVVEKNTKWADAMAAAAFIGIMAAFIARAVNGAGDPEIAGDGAGLFSVTVLVAAMIFMVLFQFLCKRFQLEKLEPFTMPLAMFAAMGVAVVCGRLLPESFLLHEWRY